MKSTSIHTLSADKRPPQPFWYVKLCFWYLFNWLNNIFLPNSTDSSFTMHDFIADTSEDNYHKIEIREAPSRIICDLFWLQLPWESISSELGQIIVLDSGCGKGNYGVKLMDYSKGRISQYIGIDRARQDNWQVLAQKYPNFQFRQLDSMEMMDFVPDEVNFFMSQSAIEHFEHDLDYFEQIRHFAQRTSKPIIQVHIFPSTACYGLFLHHGVRQYTPRTVSMITSLFQDFSYSILYRLGGKECNRLHWEVITKKALINYLHRKESLIINDFNDQELKQYDQACRQATLADNNEPHNEPSFYALVIHSNFKKVIFN
jgi:SAM-dependent methyltransferase